MNDKGKVLSVIDIGTQNYKPVWDLQKDLFNRRLKNIISDTLILVEHNHVYTIGKDSNTNNFRIPVELIKSKGIEIYNIDRGGDITYHGPGQIVGYPIFDLKQHKDSISWYMDSLEEVFIRILSEFDICANRIEKYRGVWVNNKKIVALGVKISKWITMHGFAFNVNTDLSYFEYINPCGIVDRGVCSLQSILNRKVDINSLKEKIISTFVKIFSFSKFEYEIVYDIESILRTNIESFGCGLVSQKEIKF